MPTNHTSTLSSHGIEAATLAEARRIEMAALEQLPARLRTIVLENNINICAAKVLQFFRSVKRQTGDEEFAERKTCEKLYQLEQGDIEVFAGRYLGAYRLEYGHVAAAASVLRYGQRSEMARGQRRWRLALGFGIPAEGDGR